MLKSARFRVYAIGQLIVDVRGEKRADSKRKKFCCQTLVSDCVYLSSVYKYSLHMDDIFLGIVR